MKSNYIFVLNLINSSCKTKIEIHKFQLTKPKLWLKLAGVTKNELEFKTSVEQPKTKTKNKHPTIKTCLLYTSDAADE